MYLAGIFWSSDETFFPASEIFLTMKTKKSVIPVLLTVAIYQLILTSITCIFLFLRRIFSCSLCFSLVNMFLFFFRCCSSSVVWLLRTKISTDPVVPRPSQCFETLRIILFTRWIPIRLFHYFSPGGSVFLGFIHFYSATSDDPGRYLACCGCYFRLWSQCFAFLIRFTSPISPSHCFHFAAAFPIVVQNCFNPVSHLRIRPFNFWNSLSQFFPGFFFFVRSNRCTAYSYLS